MQFQNTKPFLATAWVNSKFSAALNSFLQIFTDLISWKEKQMKCICRITNNVVQNAVMTLSKQRVRLHFEKYDCPLYGVQFINNTNLPLKIVSSEAGSDKDSF